jgi:hypothetical protein
LGDAHINHSLLAGVSLTAEFGDDAAKFRPTRLASSLRDEHA